MIFPAGKIAASMAIGAVSFASIRNMAETVHISSAWNNQSSTLELPSSSILSTYLSMDSSGKKTVSIPDSKSTDDIIDDLKAMERKDLLKLFLYCEAPDDTTEGDFDGILLNNNEILTSVSGFITNQLFGINHQKWNGKRFNNNEQTGINRFYSKAKDTNKIVLEHQFDHSITPSKLGKQENSLLLKYANYQSILSPWKTMQDELRVLRRRNESDGETCNDDNRDILLGMGSMAWSGAHFNCQPFCLVRSKQ